MKCRAKMIDGSPVTFEMTDRGKLFELGADGRDGFASEEPFAKWRHYRCVLVTDFEGEGFSVQCVTPYTESVELRAALERSHLERSGVDTATVEYAEPLVRSGWLPLFPPVPKHPTLESVLYSEEQIRAYGFPRKPMHIRPGEAVYISDHFEPDDAMINAGLLALDNVWNSQFCNRKNIVRLVWRAMEKARKQ